MNGGVDWGLSRSRNSPLRPFREVVWVLIEELHTDGWHIGGRPFEGPKSLMGMLERSKKVYESIDGTPATREEFARLAPPITA
ncbi:tautomerase [Mesorhizobium sp. LNHC252B00]|nr:tautomerase [Mesorhizobium sp. LNHC252B00]